MGYTTYELIGTRMSRIHLSVDEKRALCGISVIGEIPVSAIESAAEFWSSDAMLAGSCIGIFVQPYCKNCLRAARKLEREQAQP